jgi:hypothetical protein
MRVGWREWKVNEIGGEGKSKVVIFMGSSGNDQII